MTIDQSIVIVTLDSGKASSSIITYVGISGPAGASNIKATA